MAAAFHFACAQTNPVLGDVPGNARRIIALIDKAREAGTDLLVLPQSALTGRSCADLLLEPGLHEQTARALDALREASRGMALLLGAPERVDGRIHDTAWLFADGRLLSRCRRQTLAGASPFDDLRYYHPGDGPLLTELAGIRLGLAVGMDGEAIAACDTLRGADLVALPAAEPFVIDAAPAREARLGEVAGDLGAPLFWVNPAGGENGMVFAGASSLFDTTGNLCLRLPAFETASGRAALGTGRELSLPQGETTWPWPEETAAVYQALVLGLRDYVGKSGLRGAILGLSGGIDSALVLAIAVDALGAEAVQAVMMPYRYTSTMSLEDAETQARDMGVDYRVLPIEPMISAAESLLGDTSQGTTAENLQARCRGLLLMALSNQNGRLVLTTSNKSELAVGYTTLYGDMAGGFAPLKDCSKTLVYALARHRNSLGRVIPERVITRQPSAELREDQQDSDSLPPYTVLDPVLDAYLVERRSLAEIVAMGFDEAVVRRILKMVRRSGYKRHQAAPGVRISRAAFDCDLREPPGSSYQDA